MWFERKRSNDVPEQTPELAHWPTERMILEGHADYAVPEDLEGLDEAILTDIAQLCEVDQYAPDECIPCLAHTMVLDRRGIAAEMAEEAEAHAEIMEELEEDYPTPRLAATLAAVPPWTESDKYEGMEPPRGLFPQEDPDDTPVADQFASKVAELSLLVEELLEGPPIPPPGVSLEDLALLTLAADKWVKMSEIQGGLAPQQQQMLDATRELVTRLRS